MIDHTYTDLIVCPYCGHKDKNSDEKIDDIYDFGVETCICERCDKEFYVSVDITVKFTTDKKKD